ncbi:MAG TPA: hypothetical protein VFQ20_10055, partial [Burkholderiaceae bacterium]|nr:hypothetical protein [Burkholderiaceae bacterium]
MTAGSSRRVPRARGPRHRPRPPLPDAAEPRAGVDRYSAAREAVVEDVGERLRADDGAGKAVEHAGDLEGTA